MENANYNVSMNDKGYNNEYNKNDYYYNEFSINNNKYFQNNEKNNNIYPNTYFFGFNNNINASFPKDFFNSDENIRNKNYDNFNED